MTDAERIDQANVHERTGNLPPLVWPDRGDPDETGADYFDRAVGPVTEQYETIVSNMIDAQVRLRAKATLHAEQVAFEGAVRLVVGALASQHKQWTADTVLDFFADEVQERNHAQLDEDEVREAVGDLVRNALSYRVESLIDSIEERAMDMRMNAEELENSASELRGEMPDTDDLIGEIVEALLGAPVITYE